MILIRTKIMLKVKQDARSSNTVNAEKQLHSRYNCRDLTPLAQVENWAEILQSWGIFTQAFSWIFLTHSRSVFQPATKGLMKQKIMYFR
jgi:hypothetical protein